MDKKYFYITTPIYYASANLHIGHAYCEAVTDTIARYKRLRGYDVFFLTGADEHGEKIAQNAAKANMSCQEFVDKINGNFIENWKDMAISIINLFVQQLLNMFILYNKCLQSY